MNVTPLDADQFIGGCFYYIACDFFLYSLACNLYPGCPRLSFMSINSTIVGGFLHYLFVTCFFYTSHIEMFSIRLSEAKENRTAVAACIAGNLGLSNELIKDELLP